MSQCECCQQECGLVVPVESVDVTAPAAYDLLCPVCAGMVEQARRVDVFDGLPRRVSVEVWLAHAANMASR